MHIWSRSYPHRLRLTTTWGNGLLPHLRSQARELNPGTGTLFLSESVYAQYRRYDLHVPDVILYVGYFHFLSGPPSRAPLTLKHYTIDDDGVTGIIDEGARMALVTELMQSFAAQVRS
jgi:hypothetical protein